MPVLLVHGFSWGGSGDPTPGIIAGADPARDEALPRKPSGADGPVLSGPPRSRDPNSLAPAFPSPATPSPGIELTWFSLSGPR